MKRAQERAPFQGLLRDFLGSLEVVIADCGGVEREFVREQPPIVDSELLERQAPDVAGLWNLIRRLRAVAVGSEHPAPFWNAPEPVQARRAALGTTLVPELLDSRYGPYFSRELAGYTGPPDVRKPQPEILDLDALPLTRLVKPVFPQIALSARVFGDVRLTLALDRTSGQVAGITVVEDKPLLRQAAVDAVKQWRFDPAAGLPPALDVTIRFQYSCD